MRRVISVDTKDRLVRFVKSFWFFPALLTLIFLVLVGLKISGSSLGTYNWILGLPQKPALVAGEPRPIRSDEWLVITQKTIAQHNNGYKCINDNIGYGEDASVIALPCKDWTALFHPENVPFFFGPFNYAFAFKWWFMAYALILSAYLLVLTFLSKRYLLASLIALAVFFSPFVQWWYQQATLGVLAYSMLLIVLFVCILRAQTWKPRIAAGAGLAYTATALALTLYPPFILSCLLPAAAVCIGYFIEWLRTTKPSRRRIIHSLAIIGVAAVLVGSVVGAFLITRSDAVHAITNTVYPGKRVVEGGGMQVNKLFSGFIDGHLQIDARAKQFGLNQSENAKFILVCQFLFLPSVYLLVRRYRQKQPLDWPLLLVNATLVVFILRLFTPLLDFALDPLVGSVPPNRLVIGLGLINILHIVLFIRAWQRSNIHLSKWLVVAYGFIILSFQVGLALWLHNQYPGYMSVIYALVLAVPVPLVVLLVLVRRYAVAMCILLLLSFFTTYDINPLMRGTDVLTGNAVTNAIKDIHSKNPDARWIAEGVQFENFPQMSGAPSLSGVYQYPQQKIWQSVAPQNEAIYNRYAHVIFVLNHEDNDSMQTRLEKQQDDMFVVATEPCSDFLRKNNVQYILAQAPIKDTCLSLDRTIPYPNQTFFIYRIR